MFPQINFFKKNSFYNKIFQFSWTKAYGVAILLLISIHIFCVRQYTLYDASGFLNPPYEFVHQGRVVYPAYESTQANKMIIHPPTYSWLTGILMKLGLSYYPALMIILFIASVVLIVVIIASNLTSLTKIGFLTAIYITNFLFLDPVLVRPEVTLTFWWLAGVLVLENSRLRSWSGSLLAIGSFLVTFASSLHYYAWPGIGAIGVYAINCAVKLGPYRALPKLTWMSIGCLLYLIPYAIYFLVPHWTAIFELIRSAKTMEGITMAYARHMTVLSSPLSPVVQIESPFLRESPFFPIKYIFYPIFGVPCAFIALLLLLWRRETRLIALASAPILLSIIFIVTRKTIIYFRLEYIFWFTAVFISLISAFKFMMQKINQRISVQEYISQRLKYILTCVYKPAIFILALIYLIVINDAMMKFAFKGETFLDELRLQRSAAKEVIGENASVGSVGVLPWFTSGAAVYRDLIGDIIYPADISQLDTSALFGELDIVVDHALTSHLTYNKQRKSLVSFYLEKKLLLRGFYSGLSGKERLIFMSQHPSNSVKGFYWEGNKFYEFNSSDNGNKELVVFETDSLPEIEQLPQGAELIFSLQLPQTEQLVTRQLVMILQDVGVFEHSKQAYYRGCTLMEYIRGDSKERNPAPMIDGMSYQKEIVKYYFLTNMSTAKND